MSLEKCLSLSVYWLELKTGLSGMVNVFLMRNLDTVEYCNFCVYFY